MPSFVLNTSVSFTKIDFWKYCKVRMTLINSDMVKGKHELWVASYELRVENVKIEAEIQKC